MKNISNILIQRKDPNDHIINIDPMEKEVIPEDAWEAIKKARTEMIGYKEKNGKPDE